MSNTNVPLATVYQEIEVSTDVLAPADNFDFDVVRVDTDMYGRYDKVPSGRKVLLLTVEQTRELIAALQVAIAETEI